MFRPAQQENAQNASSIPEERSPSSAGDGVRKRFQVLSLDGGGFKGLYTAGLLARLEEDLGIDITDHFDLIVGTSTGGILALGLGLGFRPREMIQFYCQGAASIFRRPRYGKVPLLAKMHGLLKSKYDGVPLEAALKAKFGDLILGNSRKRLVIPAFDLEQRRVHLFKTRHHQRLLSDWRLPAWKVALATASAPTYFPTARCVEKLRLVDGGVWANNPTMVGVVEAIALMGQPVEAIRVLSLGTSYTVSTPGSRLERGGKLPWIWDGAIIDSLMQGQSSGALGQAVNLLGKEDVVRLDTNAPEGKFELDKLNEDELISRGVADGRHATRVFSERFLDHQAPPFVPLPPPGACRDASSPTITLSISSH